MKIAVLSFGSTGDIAPLISLCKGLISQGHDPFLVANQEVEELSAGLGVPFKSLGFSTKSLLTEEAGTQLLDSRSSTRSLKILSKIIQKQLMAYAVNIIKNISGAELLLVNERYFLIGNMIAEKQNIPLIQLCFQPKGETAMYPYLFFRPWYFMFFSNRFTHRVVDKMLLKKFLATINNIRSTRLGLQTLKLNAVFETKQNTPFLQGFSPSVFTPPKDWPEHYKAVGYWFPLTQPAYISDELDAFLSSPGLVFYIGFGSMPADQNRLLRILKSASKALGVRFLFALNWSPDLNGKFGKINDFLFVVDSIAHHDIFPRVDGAIHHGGAGTVAQALKSSTPQLIYWFMLDQEFWAVHIEKIGVGINGGCHAKMNDKNFQRHISQLMRVVDYKKNACVYSKKISGEDGVSQACEFIDRFKKIMNTDVCYTHLN